MEGPIRTNKTAIAQRQTAMRTVLLLSLVALFLALVEVRGDEEVKEVVDEEKGGKYSRSGQNWDYYEEEVASSSSSRGGARKRREAFGEEGSSGDSTLRTKRNPKKSAIRINQENSEMNTKNNTEPLLVEDPPGIGLGHILGNNALAFKTIIL